MTTRPKKAMRKTTKKPKPKPKPEPPGRSLEVEVLEGIRSEIGDDGAQLLGSDELKTKIRGVISTRCMTLDAAIGRGGIPLSRLTILHGGEGCIASGAFIPTNRAGKGESFKIEHLVKMFNGGVSGGKRWDRSIPTMVRVMQPDGTIRLARLKRAWSSGKRVVFEVATSAGRKLTATANHPFWSYVANDWVRLDALSIGECVAVEDGRPAKRKTLSVRLRDKYVKLKNHPYACARNSDSIVAYHRLVYEAHVNGVDVNKFIAQIRSGNLSGCVFFDPSVFVVHHKNGDHSDNTVGNLELLTHFAHRIRHIPDWAKNIEVHAKPERIVAVRECGAMETYDLEIDLDEPNGQPNFVANGFVVHNSGKTTVALHLVAEVQAQGGVAVYIDKEYKLDPDYATAIGVDINRLIISQPRSLEQVLGAIKKAIAIAAAARRRTGKRVPILVILDSINAATAKARLEGDEGASHIAPEARLWSGHLPAIIEECSKEDVALVLVSQVRSKIGVMFGSNEDMAGGNAPRFYASLIVYIKRVGTHKRDGEKKANIIEAECKKNQIGPPFRKGKFLLEYGKGIDWEHSLILQAEATGDVQTKGSWLNFDGERIGQGRDAAADNLRKNKSWAEDIERAVRVSLGWDEEAA